MSDATYEVFRDVSVEPVDLDCEFCGTPWGEMHGANAEYVAELQRCPRCGWETCSLCRREDGSHEGCGV